jgi:FG-GAP-like repeat
MNRKYFFCLMLVSGFFAHLFGCHSFRTESQNSTFDSSVQRGKTLASAYCQSCHQLPDPGLIDKKTWVKTVLPGMAPRLGIFVFKGHEYPSKVLDRNIGRNFYPSAPLINDGQWQDIIDYYWTAAPDSLAPIHRKEVIEPGSSLFSVIKPSAKSNIASSCMVHFDISGALRNLYLGTVIYPGVYKYDKQLLIKDSIHSRGPVVDIRQDGGVLIGCNIGYLNPNDAKLGSVERIDWKSKSLQKSNDSVIFDSLARPVQVLVSDFNQDNKKDYLICEFGNLRGQLSWRENLGNNKYSTHILRSSPGAIKAYITDYNHDGLPDIWALFAQGDECIMLFTNKGNGKFEGKKILQFPAVYGSTYFELDDFNHDGFPDILYTCGDNADYSPILKPYHGVYIFLNDGTNHFKQQYFFPMHGCFKAMARDFDGDGDLDIAAISFFPDFKNAPEESFFYLENKGGFNFQPYTIPQAAEGRWLTMDVGNFYGSGKPDIVLGNFNYGMSSNNNSSQHHTSFPFIVLKNTIK